MNSLNGLVLPREVLLKVFELLGPGDLKTAVVVCQMWRELGEDPRMWTWAVVKISTMQDLKKVDIGRLRMLHEIKVSHEDTWADLPSRALPPHLCCPPQGRAVPFRTKGQNCAPWDDKVECIWLEESNVKELLKVISKIPTVTRISGLGDCEGVSYVDPQLLVTVVNRLEKLRLWRFLTSEQVELLFRTMAENTYVKALKVCIRVKDRPLRKLKLIGMVNDMDPALLGLAINRLEEAWITGYLLNAAQLTAILTNLVQGESSLKKLMLYGLDAAAVVEKCDAVLVRRVEEKVGKFYWVGDEEECEEDDFED